MGILHTLLEDLDACLTVIPFDIGPAAFDHCGGIVDTDKMTGRRQVLAQFKCGGSQGAAEIVASGARDRIFFGNYADQIQDKSVTGNRAVDHVLEDVSDPWHDLARAAIADQDEEGEG